jgi:glucosamine 6-phosphate synthetase-like amidotransferase/phosphosugar isomerase protein
VNCSRRQPQLQQNLNNMATIANQNTTQIRVYNLYCELLEARKNKKAAIKEYTDDIKRIEEEIKEMIEQEEEETENAQRAVA